MSVRLNVVVVQSPRMTSLQVGVVAEIVIQLLGRPGIDVAMVTTLDAHESDSTDRLMLTGLESDIAVIDWRPVEQTISSLQTLGIDATRAPHTFDPEAPLAPRGSRRIYAIDLRNGFKADEVVEGLADLLRTRQTVTVSLLSPRERQPAAVTNTVPGNTSLPSVTEMPTPETLKPSAPAPTSMPSTTSPPPQPAVAQPAVAQPAASTTNASRHRIADDAELDALVDHLNGFDL